MPTNVSFLSASRAGRKGGSMTNDGYSKVGGTLATALAKPYNYFEGWMPPNAYTTPVPFQSANNGNVKRIVVSGPEDAGDASSYQFVIENAGSNDCHTNQYYNSNYIVAENKYNDHGGTYLADVVWEVSVYARVIDSGYSSTAISISSGTWQYDTDGSEGDVRCELYLFGVNSSGTPFFSGYSGARVYSTSRQSPATGRTYYYYRDTTINGNEWHLIRMYVRFGNTNIRNLTTRIDCDTSGKTVIFANPRLVPHNISLEKVMGGTGISNNDNFKFSDNLA